MNGVIGGGVEAIFMVIISSQDCMMGGAMAGLVSGISWTINKLFNNYQYSINEMLISDNNTMQGGSL